MGPDAAFVAGTVGGLAHYDTPETYKIKYFREAVKLSQH
jgi:hypothetical protein